MISDRIKKALNFAIEKHAGQLDKAGNQYFGHVIRVAFAVFDYGEDYFIVALFHDLVEDHNVSLNYIEENWGKIVRDAVESVTRIEYPVKETYMNLIKRASENQIGRKVKMAALIDNSDPIRIAALPIEQQDIVKRYERAKKFLRNVEKQKRILQHEQILINGGGA
jgi:(p)ppGpp synthase/HD superfamily hydrolase